MYPHERSLVKKLAGKPFALLGVNSDRDREAIKEIIQDKHITWRSFWNGPDGTGGPISTQWNVTGWPTIYVMDAQGVIRYKNVRGSRLDEAITDLLDEMGHTVDLTNHSDPAEEKAEETEDDKESDDKDNDVDKQAEKGDGDNDSDKDEKGEGDSADG